MEILLFQVGECHKSVLVLCEVQIKRAEALVGSLELLALLWNDRSESSKVKSYHCQTDRTAIYFLLLRRIQHSVAFYVHCLYIASERMLSCAVTMCFLLAEAFRRPQSENLARNLPKDFDIQTERCPSSSSK